MLDFARRDDARRAVRALRDERLLLRASLREWIAAGFSWRVISAMRALRSGVHRRAILALRSGVHGTRGRRTIRSLTSATPPSGAERSRLLHLHHIRPIGMDSPCGLVPLPDARWPRRAQRVGPSLPLARLHGSPDTTRFRQHSCGAYTARSLRPPLPVEPVVHTRSRSAPHQRHRS